MRREGRSDRHQPRRLGGVLRVAVKPGHDRTPCAWINAFAAAFEPHRADRLGPGADEDDAGLSAGLSESGFSTEAVAGDAPTGAALPRRVDGPGTFR